MFFLCWVLLFQLKFGCWWKVGNPSHVHAESMQDLFDMHLANLIRINNGNKAAIRCLFKGILAFYSGRCLLFACLFEWSWLRLTYNSNFEFYTYLYLCAYGIIAMPLLAESFGQFRSFVMNITHNFLLT